MLTRTGGCQILTEEQLLSRHLVGGVTETTEKHTVSRVQHAVLENWETSHAEPGLHVRAGVNNEIMANLSMGCSMPVYCNSDDASLTSTLRCDALQTLEGDTLPMTSLSHWKKKGPEILQMLFIWFFFQSSRVTCKKTNKIKQRIHKQRNSKGALLWAVVRNNRTTF